MEDTIAAKESRAGPPVLFEHSSPMDSKFQFFACVFNLEKR